MAIQATGTGCVVEVSSGGALNTQFFPTETYHYQPELFYDNVTIDGNLYFTGFTEPININDANVGGTESGYIAVTIDGTIRYIRLYATT